jgi:hypothetical protein
MKNALLIFTSLLIFACTPQGGGGSNGPKIKGKVIRVTCASTVVQILDPNYYSLGETWTKFGTNDTVQHAANVLNKCEFPVTLTEGAEFYFKEITASQARQDCAICMMYDGPPNKGIYLRVVN